MDFSTLTVKNFIPRAKRSLRFRMARNDNNLKKVLVEVGNEWFKNSTQPPQPAYLTLVEREPELPGTPAAETGGETAIAAAPVPAELRPAKKGTFVPVTNQAELNPKLYTGNPKFIKRFVLELTNHCNLRCRYCHQNSPEFAPTEEITNGTFNDILEYLSRNPIETIDLTGGGDILMATDWSNKSNQLLDLGINLDTTINLGKILDDSQVETLSRFNIVTVSIDTIDRKILSEVRKSVDIRTIVYNMMRIKAAALRRNNTKLRWIVSAVYSAEIVERLPELSSYAVAFGAMAFQIQDLMEFNAIKDNVTSVWSLKGDAAVRAAQATLKAIDFASQHKLAIHMPPHWIARLDAFADSAHKKVEEKKQKNVGTTHSTYTDIPQKGFTRDCTDPWSFMQILSDTRVRPCCFSMFIVGNVKKEKGGIDGALNSEMSHKIRKELLTGELDEYCSICSYKPKVDIGTFQQKIEGLVDSVKA